MSRPLDNTWRNVTRITPTDCSAAARDFIRHSTQGYGSLRYASVEHVARIQGNIDQVARLGELDALIFFDQPRTHWPF